MNLHLDGDLLRTFLAVADSGNFTHAAVRVGRTQSAVSMQIKRLEESVDAVLFERGARGVTLTDKGSQLLGNARRIVALFEETAALLDPRNRDPTPPGAPAAARRPLAGPFKIRIPAHASSHPDRTCPASRLDVGRLLFERRQRAVEMAPRANGEQARVVE